MEKATSENDEGNAREEKQMNDDTWDKKIKVNKQNVPKKRVREYYRKLWNKDPSFRNNLKKNGLFVRAIYNGKPTVVRHGIKVKDWGDVEELIRDH
jgi:hypothetical protein